MSFERRPCRGWDAQKGGGLQCFWNRVQGAGVQSPGCRPDLRPRVPPPPPLGSSSSVTSADASVFRDPSLRHLVSIMDGGHHHPGSHSSGSIARRADEAVGRRVGGGDTQLHVRMLGGAPHGRDQSRLVSWEAPSYFSQNGSLCMFQKSA